MKILHALVSYLAFAALPFSPFSFAHPLATIDYDGYVNTTQNHFDGALMKHALNTIAETCLAITTQNHSGSLLMERVPGDIIETRQIPVAVPIVWITVVIVGDILLTVLWIEDDDGVRGNDIEILVEHFD